MSIQTLSDPRTSFASANAEPVFSVPRPKLARSDLRRILIEWNDTRRPYPLDHCLHELIEDQVAATPKAVALECGDRSLTYAELNTRANRLAHYLRSLGVGPETLVGLFVERSPEMVIGLLGILKAGGAYVPLDPDYPEERLALMVRDAMPAVVLTQAHLESRLPGLGAPVVCLDRDCEKLAVHDGSNPESDVEPSNLAYVIYTSGSTGVPKGAMNTHEGICNRLFWMQDAYQLSARDRVLQKTPFSFDVSVWEFFWPLMFGARLVMARPGGHREPSYLSNLIRDSGVTIIHFVPSMLQAFLEESGLERSCRTLRHIFASGEALPESVARRCLQRLPGRLHNLYGPTEAAVDVTYWECRADDPAGPVPIGRPIANMRTYILDKQLTPLPIGVAGELYLGGIGVARGYLNRPELTAERFLSDPFDHRPEAQLYRTGDLCRWRPDGNIEFLGRLDHQVKLRGFRIELGEIEAALARHPAIRHAAVLLREDRPGDPRLVAYLIVGKDGNGADDAELRTFLSRGLPDHMIPSAFVRLAGFPLNASGKLDRKALPMPKVCHSDQQSSYIAPRNTLEQKLATIWQELLGVERISVHDNFFHIGGNSLLVLRLQARTETDFGVRLPISAILRAGTVEGMSALVARRGESRSLMTASHGEEVEDRVVPLQPLGDKTPVFILPGMGSHVISLRDLAITIGSERPIYGIQPTGDNFDVLPYSNLEELATELLEDLKRVQSSGPYYLLGFSAGGAIAYEMAQQLKRAGEDVALLGLLDTYGPTYAKLLPLHTRFIRHCQMIWRLPSGERWHYALDRCSAITGRVGRSFQSLRQQILGDQLLASPTDPTIDRSWRHVNDRYRPGIYDGRVELFAATRPDWLGTDWQDPAMGWETLIGDVRLHQIEGEHLEIIKLPWANQLAAAIRDCLNPV
jgi:amino acid adenylation domain-containing protein